LLKNPKPVTPFCYSPKFAHLKKLLLIALWCSHAGFSQNLIKGSVADSTGAPIPFCALALVNAKDSSLVKGNVADDKGEFLYEKIAPGNYLFKFTQVGFKTAWSQPIAVDSLSQITLPPLVLKAEGVTLKIVEVTVMKPTIEFKNGMVVMNIENNIISGGNTIFELLKRVPGVVIDAQNNITVNGRGGVRFMIDGRMQQISVGQMINMFMGMPAESVSYIELIKNPPAKYDASGTGGIINIVMKKAKVKGFSGSLSQSASHGDEWRGGTFASLNYKSNKLSVFTNLNWSYLHFRTHNYFLRRITDTAGSFEILSEGRQDPLRNIVYATAGLEYELSPKTIVGVNATGNWMTMTNQENAQIAVTGNTNPYAYNYIKFNIGTTWAMSSPAFSASLSHKFDSLTRLQVMADYTNFNDEGTRYTTNWYYDLGFNEVAPVNRFGTDMHNDFNVYTQKADLTRDFKNGLNLEAGFKSSFVMNRSVSWLQRTDLVSGELFTDTSFSYSYRYEERILAGYTTLGKTFKKLTLRAGVRSEHTLIDATTKNFVLGRNYINFFPSGSVDYKLNEKNNLQANYSYRIDRPNYDQMSPIKVYNDQFSLGSGNTSLKPQYSHNFNLDYSYNNFLTFSASGQLMKDMIYYYAYGDPKTNVTVDTVFNYPHRENYMFSLMGQKQVKWFSFQVFAAGIYRSFSGSVNGITANSQTGQYFVNGTLEFLLPKNLKIQLQGFYTSGFKDGVQYYHPKGVANFTIAKSFFNKKLDISFSIFDVFYSDIQPNTNSVGGQYSYYQERNDTRRLRGFIVWKFGKMRVNRNLQNSEGDSRIKKS